LARHLADRLGYGPRPGDLDRIASAGAERWIEQQLNPQSLPLPRDLTNRMASFVTPRLSPPQIFVQYGPPATRQPGSAKTPEQQQEIARHALFVAQESIQLRLLRALESPRQLEECLADFWFNHFNVFLGKGLDRLWVGAYAEEAIRPHILGRFRDLLGATAKHPAMLFYLDNWLNTAPGSPGARGQFEGLNENYARELMELHTLGVAGGYTQEDVIALARILTGWTIVPWRDLAAARMDAPGMRWLRQQRQMQAAPASGRDGFVFDSERHDFSDKRFLGRLVKGAGVEEGEAALDTLARSPATAQHVSYKLAQYFLADEPDKTVTAAMARTFLASDGNIRAVLQTLFSSEPFRAPAAFGAKFKSPYRYVVSAVRAAGVPVRNFRPLEATMTRLGEHPYGCLTPDGYKNTQEAWLNPDAMMLRLSFAVALATGHLPLEAAPDDMGANGAARPRLAAAAGRVQGAMPLPEEPEQLQARGPVLDEAALTATLGHQFSAATMAAIAAAPPELRAAMVLGSPEFMRC